MYNVTRLDSHSVVMQVHIKRRTGNGWREEDWKIIGLPSLRVLVSERESHCEEVASLCEVEEGESV